MRILLFIESLRSGGKERRLLELIRYLKNKPGYELLLVLTEDEIHYRYAFDLISDIKILKRKYLRKDPAIFLKFCRLCNTFKPDIIHTWGSMLAFYALPVAQLKMIPHINGHIADAPVNLRKIGFHTFITQIGFRYSDVILSNSYAGLKSYSVSGEKCRVIYNGVDLRRFDNLPDKVSVRLKYGIRTNYLIIMVASFTQVKNYDQFLEIAESCMSQRNDITFLAVGDTKADNREFERIRAKSRTLKNMLLMEKVDCVESLINACDIAVLFTHSEGISNSIIEYMACAKPVLATDAGGTREIIEDHETGFLITNQTTSQIVQLINELLKDENLRDIIGRKARTTIENRFAIELMGRNFENLYQEILKRSNMDRPAK